MMVQNGFIDYSGEIINDYQIEKIVLHHPVSTRYLARKAPEDFVYIEVLNVAPDENPELDGRFQVQMQQLKDQNHPGIAPILGLGRTAQQHAYAIVRYTPGQTLARHLADWREKERPMPIQDALTTAETLAAILRDAHAAGLHHADLCPENIVLGDDGTLVLYGLGVPYQPEPPQPIQKVQMLDYLSPEQRLGKAISGRSNIYSFGVILYEMLVGHRPEIPQSSWDIFERTTLPKETPLEEARPGLTAVTYTVVKTCLWRQEWSRYETIDELLGATKAAIEAEAMQAQRKQRAFPIPQWLYVAGPVALVLIVLAFIIFGRGGEAEGETAVSSTPLPAIDTIQETATATVTPTREQAGVAVPTDSIVLLAPTDGFQFEQTDTIIFDWVWPEPLESGQQFTIKLIDSGEMILGIVDRPVSGSQYRLTVDSATAGLDAGNYQWLVVLEAESTAEEIARSDLWQFTILAIEGTATATATIEPSVALPTPTVQCVVSPPSGWVSYTVVQGDFLYNLALETGTTVERLLEVNCLPTPGLGIGKRLWLPALPPTETPTPVPTSTPVPSEPGGDSGGGGSKPRPTKTAPPPPPQ